MCHNIGIKKTIVICIVCIVYVIGCIIIFVQQVNELLMANYIR